MSPSGDTLRLLAVWGAPTVPEIVEQLRSEPVEHSVIVLYFGTLGVTARNEFAVALRGGRKLPPTIVIDDPMFAYLATQPTPRRDITMSVALPFASAEPFTPDVAGLVPVEMFYGRAEELDQVVNMMGSCIVYGAGNWANPRYCVPPPASSPRAQHGTPFTSRFTRSDKPFQSMPSGRRYGRDWPNAALPLKACPLPT